MDIKISSENTVLRSEIYKNAVDNNYTEYDLRVEQFIREHPTVNIINDMK